MEENKKTNFLPVSECGSRSSTKCKKCQVSGNGKTRQQRILTSKPDVYGHKNRNEQRVKTLIQFFFLNKELLITTALRKTSTAGKNQGTENTTTKQNKENRSSWHAYCQKAEASVL